MRNYCQQYVTNLLPVVDVAVESMEVVVGLSKIKLITSKAKIIIMFFDLV